MNLAWAENSEISIRIEEGKAILTANPNGLISLAAHISALAAKDSESKIRYDENNGFETGSAELIVEKMDR